MADVIDRGAICPHFTNHVGAAKDGQGNIFAAFTQERTPSQPGLLIRRRQRGTGEWTDVHWFAPDGGKFGHCALECVGLHLVVIATQRDLATGETRGHEHIILNVCEL